jgi:hypothetical protein
MIPDAARTAPPIRHGSLKTFPVFRTASTEDIPDAQTHYDALVDSGEIRPAARAIYVGADGYRGPLSPPPWFRGGALPFLVLLSLL